MGCWRVRTCSASRRAHTPAGGSSTALWISGHSVNMPLVCVSHGTLFSDEKERTVSYRLRTMRTTATRACELLPISFTNGPSSPRLMWWPRST